MSILAGGFPEEVDGVLLVTGGWPAVVAVQALREARQLLEEWAVALALARVVQL
jgi:hypothetical protein